MTSRRGTRSRLARSDRTAAVAVLVCGVMLVLAYLNKARCAGAPFESDGRSVIFDRIKDSRVCYSDIQYLWVGRDINEHVFPYLSGGITPDGTLTGGAVEYPVLSGLLMWLGAMGAHNDATFLLRSALLLAPFGLATAWLLGRLSGRAALLWAAGPPLVLYGFHNWDLPVVCTAVAAVYVVTTLTRYSVRTRGVVAAVLLGIGCALKVYPGIFVLPLLIHVLVGGSDGLDALRHRTVGRIGAAADSGAREGRLLARCTRLTRRYDAEGALAVAAAAVVTVLAINLPFAVAGYDGWRASILFQQWRQADITSDSVWYWGLRPIFDASPGGEHSYREIVATASPVLVLAAFALAIWLGWRRYRICGLFEWVGVSGAMLCGFLLFHKVDSPQYTLWLIPFLVLLEVPWPAVAAYLLADAALGIGVFRYYHVLGSGDSARAEQHVVEFGVWGRALLLVYFFVVFLRANPRVRRRPAPPKELAPVAAELVTTPG
ncbi:hypothetical protein [Nocardia alni]|uniref:hypothetical protein n=1 Tax=Nocardia alni TaxID=2815723 RepID=UPI001C241C32|nr:hypothetical protein [Nocardia alni]